MNLYKCPKCGESSSAARWNTVTQAEFPEPIIKITHEYMKHASFVCPVCLDESSGGSIILSDTITPISVKIKRLREDIPLPVYQTESAAGFDLIAAEDVIIEPGETRLVPTGLAIELPPGYELQIRPRSGVSLYTKLRIGNSPGTIDGDYRGEIGLIIDNITSMDFDMSRKGYPCYLYVNSAGYLDGQRVNTEIPVLKGTYIIRKGDRIAQGVIQRIERADFVVVDELTETERGADGFGSTGVSV